MKYFQCVFCDKEVLAPTKFMTRLREQSVTLVGMQGGDCLGEGLTPGSFA